MRDCHKQIEAFPILLEKQMPDFHWNRSRIDFGFDKSIVP